MREKNCLTMLDPFHVKYGKELTAGLSVAPIVSDLLMVTATQIGLGTYL